MGVRISDRDMLLAVSPAALSVYARSAGWRRQEQYRTHSDVYTGKELPEIIVPRTERLGDYASVVASLIDMFAKVVQQDELTVYRSLVIADRDVVRIRAGESEDGSIALNHGVDLIGGAYDMLLAAACSLGELKPVYRAGANRDAADLLERVRLGQTDQGSFVVTLLTPAISPALTLFPVPDDQDAPIERRLTLRLMEALVAARDAVERTAAGDRGAFREALESGLSANMCEALARIIGRFLRLDVNVLWARTRPVTVPRPVFVRFGRADAFLLSEAARSLKEGAPRPDVRLIGYVRLLARAEAEEDGTIRLATKSIDRQLRSVTASLERQDYEQVVQAHKDQVPVVLTGDLERMGQRWRLLNPRLEEVLRDDGPEY